MRSRNGANARLGRQFDFTLVELLVVIAIIALLSSLLFPALGAARGKAVGVACLGNLRQLGQAIFSYSVDNDDYFPPNLAGEGIAGVQAISSYIGIPFNAEKYKAANQRNITIEEVGVLYCPADDFRRKEVWFPWLSYGNSSFCMTIAAEYTYDPLYHFRKTREVRNPSRFILRGDSWRDTGRCVALSGTVWPFRVTIAGKASRVELGLDYRHAGLTNILWVDGHVGMENVDKFFLTGGQYLLPQR